MSKNSIRKLRRYENAEAAPICSAQTHQRKQDRRERFYRWLANEVSSPKVFKARIIDAMDFGGTTIAQDGKEIKVNFSEVAERLLENETMHIHGLAVRQLHQQAVQEVQRSAVVTV